MSLITLDPRIAKVHFELLHKDSPQSYFHELSLNLASFHFTYVQLGLIFILFQGSMDRVFIQPVNGNNGRDTTGTVTAYSAQVIESILNFHIVTKINVLTLNQNKNKLKSKIQAITLSYNQY